MVAVLTVFANHLWDWPRGGFIGVDVFFVISGFLITGNLLRTAERTGTVSFIGFYWNRVRRIVPAATVVLFATYIASVLLFLPFRSQQVGVDALFAFVFLSNWRFAAEGTDYFQAAAETVSPLQHYWSLSIEEQFYFVWPALIFLISLIVMRKGWTHAHRMRFAAGVMGVIVALSLAWALYETSTSPTWAYFNTFARVWELGIGALLATAAGLLARIPRQVKPALSWLGLASIAASVTLIGDDSVGFPAPWAILPVAGAALVIAAGVDGEPGFQSFLRNPASTYIGNISYSLYLVHWPVIVLLGTMMDSGLFFSLVVVSLSFALAIASYHFVENPLRRADRTKFRNTVHEIRRRRYEPERSSGYAALGALTLLVAALAFYVERPAAYQHSTPPPLAAVAPSELDPSGPEQKFGPLTTALQAEIVDALKAQKWPALDPSIEQVINDDKVGTANVPGCGGTTFVKGEESCTWGSPTAPVKVVIIGNSVALYYVEPLREIALASGGQIQVHTEAMPGCNFVAAEISNEDPTFATACPGRKQHAIDYINANKPSVVVISHNYVAKQVRGTDKEMTPTEWAASMQQFVDGFRGNVNQVVLLAPPPGDVLISQCYGKRGNTPADCVGEITNLWRSMAKAEQDLATALGGTWIDSRPWFCSSKGEYCPSFVGTTPTKQDRSHMVPAYGLKIFPVIGESLKEAGVF